MITSPIIIPPCAYNHPIERTLLDRLEHDGTGLVEQYIDTHSKNGIVFVSRDAAKKSFPEFQENPIQNNRYADGAASALADAVRRTLLAVPANPARNRVVMFTGAPASGKTRAAGPFGHEDVEIQHETILTSIPRAVELIQQTLAANRAPIIRLFYTDDPRINVRRMISRARTIGRTVPLSYMAKTYVGVPAAVDHLRSAFGDVISIRVTNNSESPSQAVHHNRIDRALYHVDRYTEKTALEAMRAEFDKICKNADGVPAAIRKEALRV